MRMSNQMREIMNDISATRTKLQAAVKDRNAEEAKKQKEKLDELNALFAAAEADFNAEQNAETPTPKAMNPKAQHRSTTRSCFIRRCVTGFRAARSR